MHFVGAGSDYSQYNAEEVQRSQRSTPSAFLFDLKHPTIGTAANKKRGGGGRGHTTDMNTVNTVTVAQEN